MNVLRIAISNDSIAAMYQSVDEYRRWLLALIDGLDKAQYHEAEPIEHDGWAGEPQGMEKAP